MIIRLSIFVLSIMMIQSCNMKNASTSPSAKAENTKDMVGDAYALINQDDLKEDEIMAMRISASNILDHRIKEAGGKSVTILEKDIWKYDATVMGSKMISGDTLGGRWIDYKENLTYEYGRYDKQDGGGKYYYDFDLANLLMVDNNVKMKPQEFEVKVFNDMLVLVGSYLYHDNNIQTKLTRKTEPPVKPGN